MSAAQVSISQALPSEVLAHIFYFLDASSLSACSITSKALQQLIERRLWKQISQRDYLPFLCQAPLESQDLAFPIRESDIQVQKDYFADANRAIQELKTGKYNQVEGLQVHVRDWKGFYSQKYEAIDLNGYWVGDYGKGSELVRIYQNGYHLVAKKLTGDTNVPSGKITWEMHLDGSLKKGKGKFQLTEANYENPKLVQAYLQVINKNIVKITWLFQHARGNWYTVTFTNVRAGCGNFEEKTMSRKIDLLKLEKDSDNWVDNNDKNGQSL